jgi:hypothetical protein
MPPFACIRSYSRASIAEKPQKIYIFLKIKLTVVLNNVSAHQIKDTHCRKEKSI